MKKIALIILLISSSLAMKAQILIANNAKVSFFSKTIVEDIEGISNNAVSVLDLKSREIIFRVKNTSFQFKKKLMQEHFNENYIESEKYPTSEFKGTIKEAIDLSKDGVQKVTVEGNLNIHGITKPYKTQATLTISKGMITAKAMFKVRIDDHGIEIPTVVFKNIAEFVEVSIQSTYKPKQP